MCFSFNGWAIIIEWKAVTSQGKSEFLAVCTHSASPGQWWIEDSSLPSFHRLDSSVVLFHVYLKKLLISPGWVGRLRAVTLNTNTHSRTHKSWQCCTTDRVCMSVYCMDSPSFRSLTRANIDTNTSHPISLLGRTMTAMSVLTNLLKPHTHTHTQIWEPKGVKYAEILFFLHISHP